MFNWDRRYLLAAFIILLLITFIGGMKYGDLKEADPAQDIIDSAAATAEIEPAKTEEIQVYVDGEVEKPGLYKLKAGSRVFDALELAGILPGADLKSTQPARKLQDGETIDLLAEGEPADLTAAAGPGAATVAGRAASPLSASGKININTASVQELDDKLPGIGPALAQRIVDYRTANGAFTIIDDINNVNGIGDKKFAAIKDLICVR